MWLPTRERLRADSADAQAALARPGRYRQVTDILQAKEVRIADDERFGVGSTPRPPTATPPCGKRWSLSTVI
jgi:hypothetical protein